MSPQSIDPGLFSPDVLEFLRQLNNHGVHFMIVGGEAVIFYGHIRLTGDVDVFFDRSPGNAARLFEALQEYWQGVIPGLDDPSQLEDSGVVFQFGIPPNRIDLLNDIDGVSFDDAWPRRTEVMIGDGADRIPLSYIGLDDLIVNKRVSGRPKDLDDLPFLIDASRSVETD